MFQQFLLDQKLYRNNFWSTLAIQTGAFLFGLVMTCVIMTVDDNPGSWFCMGTLISTLALIVIAVFFYGFSYVQQFQLALSMGRTRMDFLGAYALRLVTQLLAGYGLILLFHQIELHLYPVLFRGFENDLFFAFLTDWRIILPLFPVLTILTLFIGALYAYFGKKGTWCFYVLWMFCCFILPRMFHVTSEDTGVLNRTAYWMVSAFLAVPVGVWIGFGILLLLAMAAAIVRLGQLQMVK